VSEGAGLPQAPRAGLPSGSLLRLQPEFHQSSFFAHSSQKPFAFTAIPDEANAWQHLTNCCDFSIAQRSFYGLSKVSNKAAHHLPFAFSLASDCLAAADRLDAIPYLATAQRTPTWLARHGITINVAHWREMPLDDSEMAAGALRLCFDVG
jgi:hypothetical protein